MIIIGYIRVSTDDQHKFGYRLEEQRFRIKKYYEENFDERLTTLNIIEDKVSGLSLNRRGVQKILKLVEMDRVQAVIFINQDRLTREPLDGFYLVGLFDKYNVEMHSVEGRIDLSTADGEYFFTTKTADGKRESRKTGERTVDGLKTKARAGEYYGSVPPKGYLIDEDKKLIPDPKYKRIINQIYKMYFVDVMSINKLSKELASSKMTAKMVEHLAHKVIKKEIYIGIFEYHGELVNDIIKEQVVDQKWVRLAKRKHHLREKRHHNKIEVYCGKCGRLMFNDSCTNRHGNLYLYKTCRNCKIRFNQREIKYTKKDLKEYESLFYDYIEKEVFIGRKRIYHHNLNTPKK